jgi:hypothetical protein
LRQEELERIIQYWEGSFAGIQVGLNVDVAEILVRLPTDAQAIAFETLKDAEANPVAWEITRRFFSLIIAPMIEKFIADLRSLRDDGR